MYTQCCLGGFFSQRSYVGSVISFCSVTSNPRFESPDPPTLRDLPLNKLNTSCDIYRRAVQKYFPELVSLECYNKVLLAGKEQLQTGQMYLLQRNPFLSLVVVVWFFCEKRR